MTRTTIENALPAMARCATEIVATLFEHNRRVLLFGPPGIGKSTLTTELAHTLATAGRRCWCLSADPGSPAFGVPGAVTLAKWDEEAWLLTAYAALCTLDAGRFRLPLVSAVRQLAQQAVNGVVLIDGPGVIRGVAGRELLQGLVEAAEVDAILALTAAKRPPPLSNELRALAAEVVVVHTAAEARRPGKRIRARRRTEQWNTYLASATTQRIDLAKLNLIGTPPPVEEVSAWSGRQIALLQANRTLVMGEVQQFDTTGLIAKLPAKVTNADTLLVRDALRTTDGLVETATPFAAERLEYLPPADVAPSIEENGGPRVVGRVGVVDVGLVNGVFGDPLLHLRLRHQRRSMLFDLGEGGRLPARIAHQLTDVFISHAHMDHIGGFFWLLRSRLGEYPPCRIYGPPGLAQHIEGFIHGILWDRVAERGPIFDVAELNADRLQRFRLQAGYPGRQKLEQVAIANGILLEEPGFCVRSVMLDHRGTPVMAYAFESAKQINIRKDRLLARGWTPGPWLTELKQHLIREHRDALIQLPDGNEVPAGVLGDELTLISPGKKLVYATDLADSVDNRQRLVMLAQHAHTFFCEAPFVAADADHAVRNGHLTTHACAEIATAAGVARLVPFHFSRRYTRQPQQIYEEVSALCSRVVAPKSMRLFETSTATGLEPVVSLN